MKLAQPELRSRLAAEYVLGTMKGGARRRFQDYLKRDAALQAEVARWEAHMTPLAQRLPAIEPPARVWDRIQSQLDGPGATVPSKAASGMWQSLGFWRNWGLGVTGLAAALLFAVVTVKPVEQEPILMSVLAEDNNDVRVYIEQPESNVLHVTMVKPWNIRPGIVHQLWVMPKAGGPRSVGVINSAADTNLALTGLDAKLVDGALFAVSLEPPGGSPTGTPTGKVVCKGSIAWMPQKTAKPRAQT